MRRQDHMSLFLSLLSFLFGRPKHTGLLIEDPEKLSDFPRHELFGSTSEPKETVDWTPLCPPFRNQGSSYFCTAYAGTTIASILDKKERGGTTLFSPLELFYRAGGTVAGNYVSKTAEAMRNAVVLERDVPTPEVRSWGYSVWRNLWGKAMASKSALDLGKQFAVKNYASVKTDTASLRAALQDSPLAIVIGIGRGYWDNPAPRTTRYSVYHVVVLVRIEPDGTKVVFDSLQPRGGFDGFHRLSPDYEILSAFSFIDLPNDWQKRQTNQLKQDYSNALNHYGKARILPLEQTAAQQLSDACKKNPTVAAQVGAIFTVCVNAVAYGGYSVQDLLNHFTNIRRTGKPIWDLNRLRSKQ